MDSSFSTKVKVGITTVLAITVLIVGVFWAKDYNPAIKKLRFTVVFSDGDRIASGDPIILSGIKIGEVSGVSLTADNKAAIELFVTKRISLSDDTQFTIMDVGLMGDKALVIYPGTSTVPLDVNKLYPGIEVSSMSDLLGSADAVLKKLGHIAEKLDKDVDIGKLTGSFEQTLEKIRLAVDEFAALAVENREPLKNSISNFNEASREMRDFVKNNDTKFVQALESFQQTTENISTALDNFNKLSAIIDTVSAYMDSGEGTLARLIKTDELYEELRQTNANLDSFVIDFKNNPGKYTKDMNFKIRLF